MRPRLLLLEPDAAFRLGAISALREAFEVSVPEPGEDPLRFARATRPEVALLASGDRQRVEALRIARVLKTDVRAVPGLGLYARRGERGPSGPAFHDVAADGYFPELDDPAALVAFAIALGRGGRAGEAGSSRRSG